MTRRGFFAALLAPLLAPALRFAGRPSPAELPPPWRVRAIIGSEAARLAYGPRARGGWLWENPQTGEAMYLASLAE